MSKRSIARRVAKLGAIAAVGFGVALSAGTASASYQPAGPSLDIITGGNYGIGNGNQVVAPIQIPVNVCGNAVAVAGVAGAGCDGGSEANLDLDGLGDMFTGGNYGIGNGNQVQAPVQIPINVCGNAVAVLGVAGAGCDGGAEAELGTDAHVLPDMVTGGNYGIGDGNQVVAPVQVPVDVSGNAVSVAGLAEALSIGGAEAELGDDREAHIMPAPASADCDESGMLETVLGLGGC